MAINLNNLLTLEQFKTGLQASKNYTDAEIVKVNAEVAKKAAQTALDETNGKVATLEGTVGTQGTAISTLEGKVATLEANGYDDTEVRGLIKTNADAIDAIEADYLKAADKTALQEQITANAEAISLLSEGVDAEKVDGVKDLIAYVEEHGTEVTGMKEDIQENADAIADIVADYLKAADKTALQGQITDNANAIDAIEADYLKAADIANKADKATTLAGYGIGDAYTKGEVDGLIANHIELGDISAETTGVGNAVTAVAYDAATGKFTATKGATYLTESDVVITVASNDAVTAACTEVFGA